ncbi:MAG TPA: CPBP family intramembrane glutamic endopeptidase [Anaeromyxobacter sp.]|nr:CPBP family intramembrane glutamic endopeptidase [Anaeromyxobacter sp.]
MPAWIVCPACKLKHSARPDGLCPRCRAPAAPGAPASAYAPAAPPQGGLAPAPDARGAPPAPLDAAAPAQGTPGEPLSPPGAGAAGGRPRVWTVFLAYVCVLLALVFSTSVVIFVAIGMRAVSAPGPARNLVRASLESNGVLLGGALAAAVVQVAVALAAGGLSREPLWARLAVRGPRVAGAWLAVAAAGGVALGSSFDAALGALGGTRTGSLAQLARAIAGLSGGGLVVTVAVVGLVAPVAEELFFRGYVQTRLCRRWGTWPGIAVTAALFGLVHFDWIHSPSALVIGLYLGWLAARSGGIALSVAAHAVNNLLWVVATWAGLGANLSRGTNVALLAAFAAGAVGAIGWLRPRLATGGAAPRASPTAARLAAGAVGLATCVGVVGVGAILAAEADATRPAAPQVPLGDVVDRLSGSDPTWSIDLPGGHWRSLKQHAQARAVTRADEVVVWPEMDARIAVIAEPLSGRKVSLGAATGAAIERARLAVGNYEEVSRKPLGTMLDGNLVRATGWVGDRQVALLTAVFVYPEASIELQAQCPAERLDDLYDEFRDALDSLRR